MVEYKYEYNEVKVKYMDVLHKKIEENIEGFMGLRAVEGQELVAIFDRVISEEEKKKLDDIINNFKPEENIITLVAYEGSSKD